MSCAAETRRSVGDADDTLAKTGRPIRGAERKKVKKMLIDAKIPLDRRAALPMLAAGDFVVWIPGFPPARGYEMQPGAETYLLAEISGPIPLRFCDL